MPALPPHMRPDDLRPDVPVSAAEDPSRWSLQALDC